MSQDDFRDNLTGRCKQYMPRTGESSLSIINVEDPESYDFFRNSKCLKGNVYATCCEYCAKESCLYFDPEVNLVPKGQGMMAFMTKQEAEQYLTAKTKQE